MIKFNKFHTGTGGASEERVQTLADLILGRNKERPRRRRADGEDPHGCARPADRRQGAGHNQGRPIEARRASA